MNGYFSQEAAELIGYCIYSNEKGEEISVTEACADKPLSKWEDLVSVGEVDRFLRRIEGKISFDSYDWEPDYDGEMDDEYKVFGLNKNTDELESLHKEW